MKQTLIPDWVIPASIGLVWPEDLQSSETQTLVNTFFIDLLEVLLEELPGEVGLTIIHRPGEKQRLINYFGTKRVKLIGDERIQDIWIRDFAPFWKRTEQGNVPVKGLYLPSYEDVAYQVLSEHDDDAGRRLGGRKTEVLRIDDDEIVLDGGNLVHNGNGLAIVTNRFISDNEWYFVDKLTEVVKRYLGLDEIILIPSEWGDDTGHADGVVRFLSEHEVIVSEYPYEWRSNGESIDKIDYLFGKSQLDEIAFNLKSRGLTVHRMPNGIPVGSEDFEIATGNYTNFLRVGEKFFMPSYEDSLMNKNAFEALARAGISEKNIIQKLDCTQLASLGGVLNCISTHIYS